MSNKSVPPSIPPLRPDTVIRLPELATFLNMSRFEITKLARAGKFPMFSKLSGKLLVWQTNDVLAWIKTIGKEESK